MRKQSIVLCACAIVYSGLLFAEDVDGIPVVRDQDDRVIVVERDKGQPVGQSHSSVAVEVSHPNDTASEQTGWGSQAWGSGAQEQANQTPQFTPTTSDSASSSDFSRLPMLAADDTEQPQPISAVDAGSDEPTDDQRFWELYHQLQVLTEEVRQLRGAVEVNENLVRQLDKRQAKNYVDLDERLSGIESGGDASQDTLSVVQPTNGHSEKNTGSSTKKPALAANTGGSMGADAQALLQTMGTTGSKAAPDERNPVKAQTSQISTAEAVVGPAQLPSSAKATNESALDARVSEKTAYDEAYAFLERRDFEAALSGFEQFIKDFPKGEFRGNALYWLAELSLRQKQPAETKALEYIEALIKQYPDHARIPDALYKQATLKYRQNETEEASTIYSQIVDRHPNTTAARLADHQLRRMSGELH